MKTTRSVAQKAFSFSTFGYIMLPIFTVLAEDTCVKYDQKMHYKKDLIDLISDITEVGRDLQQSSSPAA